MAHVLQTTTDEFLGGRLALAQPRKGFRAGSDSVFLAAACPATTGQSVLELGCGVGTALYCLGRRIESELHGVEIVPEIAALARHNGLVNGLSAQIYTGDIAEMPDGIRSRRFDHVLMNPPYFSEGTAAEDAYRDTARRENTPLSTWIDSGIKRLEPGGVLTLIHKSDRLAELLALLHAHNLHIEIKPLVPRDGRQASRVILRARRGGGAETVLHSALVLHVGAVHLEGENDFSAEAEAALKHGMALKF